jgi:arsenate reductase
MTVGVPSGNDGGGGGHAGFLIDLLPSPTMDVQIFGVKSDADTRKALRFFKERRIKVHFVDFKIRGPSKGELRRFFQKFGAESVVDRGSKRFQALGLRAAHYGDERWMEIAEEEPLILRTPLVRCGNQLSVGHAESVWQGWS